MKKNFIGFAMVGLLLAGCQTAKKANNDDMNKIYGNSTDYDAMFPGYGSDRRPASGTADIIGDVFKSLKGVAIKLANGEKKNAREEFISFINTSDNAEVKDLKTKLKKEVLTESDIRSQLKSSTQTELSSAFLKTRGLQDMKSLNGLRNKVEAQMEEISKTDTEFASRRNTQKLLREETANNGSNIRKEAKNGELSSALRTGEENLVKGLNEADAKAVRADFRRVRILAGEIWDLTGDSHLIPETCDNLDRASIKAYGDLLENIRDDLSKYSKRGENGRWARVKCRNIDKLTAWIAAKFQVLLGRTGIAAWTAVEEMTFCKYLKDDVAPASRSLASEFNTEVPKSVNCQY